MGKDRRIRSGDERLFRGKFLRGKLLPDNVAIDLDTQGDGLNIQLPRTRVVCSTPYVSGWVFTSSEETQEPKNPSQIQMDRSLVDMAFTEGMDLLDDVHNLIMPPQSPTSMLKEIPDFDDFSEDSRP